MGVDLVLEVIDADAVGQERQRADQVHAAEAVRGVLTHQLADAGEGQEFQAHRVDLGRLHRRPEVIDAGLVAAFPVLERVPHLVREHADIVVACR